ncbi:MAG: hypothetical protein OXF56_22765 [Rhodobacteraceae bacterium]|nr:hypothetical protein [Paracoccaceae bacterium]
MKSDLPAPEHILEELADKSARQIDRGAPVAFDSAFTEMTAYHRFLLSLYASSTPDGEAFSYAEVAGASWNAPHSLWIRQYNRLFERAANRLPDDDHFILELAQTPYRLFPRSGDPGLPANVVASILALGPMMMSRLEAWVTKRTYSGTAEGEPAEPRLSLAGSDGKAYSNVLPTIVGAWENVLRYSPTVLGWRDLDGKDDFERWSCFRLKWPILWEHLSNTAYCLAISVWNEDEAGAKYFREALVRWPQHNYSRFGDQVVWRHRRLLYPGILSLDWDDAKARVDSIALDFMPPPSPDLVFEGIIRGAYGDVLILTSALMLHWTITERQVSDIGARTAKSLLRREGGNEGLGEGAGQDFVFHSLFLDLLRLRMAGEHIQVGTHTGTLNKLVEMLDNLAERRVVPGRVYSPSTLLGKHELHRSFVAILLAAVPDEGVDGSVDRIATLAREEEVLPKGDQTLRDIIQELETWRSDLEQLNPQIAQCAAILAPNGDIGHSQDNLREIIDSTQKSIEGKRFERLKSRPVDPEKLEEIRSTIETALRKQPPEISVFERVQVGVTPTRNGAEIYDHAVTNLSKGQLTNPPMEPPISDLAAFIADGAKIKVENTVWAEFRRLTWTMEAVRGRADEEEFWVEISPLVSEIETNPVLVVCGSHEGKRLRRILYADPADKPNLTIERKPRGQRGRSYIATVQGVDVHKGELSPGNAWLFSAQALISLQYSKIGTSGHFVDVTYEPDENLQGALRVQYAHHLEWADMPMFELRVSD